VAGPRKQCGRDTGKRSLSEAVGVIDVVHEDRAGGQEHSNTRRRACTGSKAETALHRSNHMQRHETVSSADGRACIQAAEMDRATKSCAKESQSGAGRTCGMQRVRGKHQEVGEHG
jgi:hypothetical protein